MIKRIFYQGFNEIPGARMLHKILAKHSTQIWASLPSRQYVSTRQETRFPGPKVINENNIAQ
jgi:hypothetical protein